MRSVVAPFVDGQRASFTPHKSCDITLSPCPPLYTLAGIFETFARREVPTHSYLTRGRGRRKMHQGRHFVFYFKWRRERTCCFVNVFISFALKFRSSPPTPVDKERALVARSGDDCQNERPLAPVSTPCFTRNGTVRDSPLGPPLRRKKKHCWDFDVRAPPNTNVQSLCSKGGSANSSIIDSPSWPTHFTLFPAFSQQIRNGLAHEKRLAVAGLGVGGVGLPRVWGIDERRRISAHPMRHPANSGRVSRC